MDHPNLWVVACDYTSGRRVAFGRIDAPRAAIRDAVAASCAIPGFYRPVRIGGRRYVDGGICSASNLDLVSGLGLDLVVCLNPLSSAASGSGPDALSRLPIPSRRANRRRLEHEERKVRRFGTQVLVIEPTPEDHAVMGRNWMSAGRRGDVMELAERTVREKLRRPAARELLAELPKGEPHKIRRPEGPPSAWPALRPAGRSVA